MEDYKNMWNKLGDDVPDSWGRKEYADGWLWPHLYRLLSRKGKRYGAGDPGKGGLENDYAGILIRKYDAKGKEISNPVLVSATWHAVGGNKKVSHVAGSEEFILRPSTKNFRCKQGSYKVWLVFADTWGNEIIQRAPRESAGETIAYFVINFTTTNKAPKLSFSVKQPGLPAPKTSFKWNAWSHQGKDIEGDAASDAAKLEEFQK